MTVISRSGICFSCCIHGNVRLVMQKMGLMDRHLAVSDLQDSEFRLDPINLSGACEPT